MKHFTSILTLSLFLSVNVFAQAPQLINYQAVARDASGNLIANQAVQVRFTVHQGSANGTVAYQESHSVTTNDYGLFSLHIGEGTVNTGSFSNIPWGSAACFLQVEINDGNGYLDLGTTQLVSVPYALYANEAGNVVQYMAGSGISIAGDTISNTAPDQAVTLTGAGATTVTGTYPNFTISSTDNNTTYSAGTGINISGTTITNTGDTDASDDITNTTSAGGDLSGTYPNPTVSALQGNAVSSTAPANNQVLKWNGSAWAPAADLNNDGDWTVSGSTLYVDTSKTVNTGSGTQPMLSINGPYLSFLNTGKSVFIGEGAGMSEDLNSNKNIFIGYQTGKNTTSGFENSAIGYQALYHNTTGYDNTATGYQALYSNTIGSYNIANGYVALYSNTTGSHNMANGYQALYSNTIGSYNIANGYVALYSNTTGSHNMANGYKTLYHNVSGSENIAHGFRTLYNNTTGSDNVAIGGRALSYLTQGYGNSAMGKYAGHYLTTQSYNVMVGNNAGDFNTFSYGSFLGSQTYPSANGFSNITGIGYTARPTASNSVRIGNSSVSSIGGYAAWTNLSDGRYKNNVQENVHGLDFILKLRPVTYNMDVWKLAEDLKEDQIRDEEGNIVMQEPDELTRQGRDEKAAIVYTGFIAQEVEKTAREVGYDFSGVDAPKNENDFYGLRYAEFVVPLVKGMQEQQEMINTLLEQNKQQQQLIIKMQSEIQELKQQ